DAQLNMLDLNVGALHTLTRLYLDDMRRKNKGYILNVASLASFGSGPLLAAYYATKAYIFRLSTAIAQELRAEGSNVHISVLCPGPVDTKFNDRAGVEFSMRPMTSRQVAVCGVKGMFKGKEVIIPGFLNKLTAVIMKFLPLDMQMNACYKIQHKKLRNTD
ncbi:MAG: SDR family NAD(P)-dependent oxidoreductase, partial [Firmicutes bacterium]|nr:SDR family NAD(P)-dependent oxidoreductase [Bacillota bacterium]